MAMVLANSFFGLGALIFFFVLTYGKFDAL